MAAAQNILLQEVRNPNGDFDTTGGAAYNHYFNYAPGDYVNLSAGNLVQLGASVALPRLSGANNNLPIIYPSTLNITAGDGGVTFGAPGSATSLTLFPSPQGSLTIATTGALVGDLNTVQGAPQLFNLIVSDAGHDQYTSSGNFGINDHATLPIHANSPTPLSLDIGGDMDLMSLTVPESAQISVGGNMNNCSFQGMNLSAAPAFETQILEADGSTRTVTVNPSVTSISVAGDIFNRGTFTSVNLSQVAGTQAPDLAYLSDAVNNTIGGTSISAATLATSFYYNPTTQNLTYQNIPGVNLASVLNLLQNLTVQQVDQNGNLMWLDPQQTIPDTMTVSVLNSATAQALLAQYAALGAIPASANGYAIGGGGQFDLSARTIDLGTSPGIQSLGVGLYTYRGTYPLAGLFGNGGVFNQGADISVTTTGNHSAGETATGDLVGDIDMYSSSIASLNGGNISINAGGDVNAGSSVISVNSANVRGIYSSSQGDVSVLANGDINVNGSRIATYDGGNLTVESLHGSINAGTGASLPVSISAYYEDPSRTRCIPTRHKFRSAALWR